MKFRSVLMLGVFLASSLGLTTAGADNIGGTSEVIVGVIDTGVRATHQELTYGGPTSTTDQFVAWWDFTNEVTSFHFPNSSQLWDTKVADPYDNHGHGTATASAAVGKNASSSKEPSFAPGFKVAVAKVGNAAGELVSVDQPLRWLVNTVKADVVNISIGTTVPFPGALDSIDDTIAEAKSKGVLVVVSNGNGFLNAGVPGDPGWANPYSPVEALSVGGSGVDGLRISTDPEVAAKFTQRLASRLCNSCYVNQSGTSFAAPLVAGMAAKLMATAITNGHSASADYIESLVKYSATDTEIPPSFEGYGVLDATSFAVALANAQGGTLPSRPSPDVSGIYVESIGNQLRHYWN